MDTNERFESVDDDYIEFDRVENKKNSRPDIHAFILLSELFPNKTSNMVCAAGHDQTLLDVEGDEIEKLTDDNILELVRCGVSYDENTDSLTMSA